MVELAISISILAGGQSRRMGQPKSFVELAGKPLIQHLIERIHSLNYPIQIIANNPEAYEQFDLPVFPDVLVDKGALGGIYSALFHSSTPYTLCLACDMPFVNIRLINYMVECIGNYDVIVPMVDDYPQGLHALYHQRCNPIVEHQIMQSKLQLNQIFSLFYTNFISETALRHIDTTLHAFTNLNTPQELQAAEALYQDLHRNI